MMLNDTLPPYIFIFQWVPVHRYALLKKNRSRVRRGVLEGVNLEYLKGFNRNKSIYKRIDANKSFFIDLINFMLFQIMAAAAAGTYCCFYQVKQSECISSASNRAKASQASNTRAMKKG